MQQKWDYGFHCNERENLNCKALLMELIKTRTVIVTEFFWLSSLCHFSRLALQSYHCWLASLTRRTWNKGASVTQYWGGRWEKQSREGAGPGQWWGRNLAITMGLSPPHYTAFWEAFWKMFPDHHPGREKEVYLPTATIDHEAFHQLVLIES